MNNKVTKLIYFFIVNILLLSGTFTYGEDEWESYALDCGQSYRGLYPSMDIDENRSLHISYFNVYYDNESALIYSDLKYAMFKDGEVLSHWTIDIFDDFDVSEYPRNYMSLKLDSSGKPHIAYCNPESSSLRYAYFDHENSKWFKKTIKSDGVGLYVSIAIDENDNPHISYYDVAGGALKYAYMKDDWYIENVDNSTEEVGMWNSIDVDSSEIPHISYYDKTKGALKYAFLVGTGWQKESVDNSTNDVGMYASLALDSESGLPRIAYYDNTFKALKYAIRYKIFNVFRWRKRFVDLMWGDSGSYCSLKLDSDNNPHISYYDATSFQIKYATKSGPRWLDSLFWHREIPYNESFSGPYNCLALDEFDKPYIAFFSSIEKPQVE